jgi:hypothetical protein
MYDGARPVTANTWTRIQASGDKPTEATAFAFELFDLDPVNPTYVVGLMVSEDALVPYTNTNYPSTHEPLGADGGFVLKDKAQNAHSILFLESGQLKVGDWGVWSGLGTNILGLLGGLTSTPSTMPTATAARRGQFLTVQGGAGVADKCYQCQKLADDTYSWVAVT